MNLLLHLMAMRFDEPAASAKDGDYSPEVGLKNYAEMVEIVKILHETNN